MEINENLDAVFTSSNNNESSKSKKDFSYEIDPIFGDHILEEGPNTCIIMRKISWNGRPFKLDIRKYTFKDKEEIMMKGVTLSDEGVNELAENLVDQNYGHTRKLIRSIRSRSDFEESMLDPNSDLEDESDNIEKSFFDPKQLIDLNNDKKE